MKCFLLILQLVVLIDSVYSQDYKNIYYNSNWEVTSKKSATYYRNSGFDSEKMVFDSIVSDYFISGKLEMKGFYSKGIKNGKFIYYYPNGTIFLNTEYKNNKRIGIWTEYFNNGKVKREVEYKDNKEYLLQYNDSLGLPLKNRNSYIYKLEYLLNDYYNSTEIFRFSKNIENYKLSGEIRNNLKEGFWILKKNNKLYGEVKYINGTFVNGYLKINNSEVPILSDDLMPLLIEPEKIKITEGVFLEEGQLINDNYLFAALKKAKQRRIIKINLENKEELIEYFSNKFSIRYKNCDDTVNILVKLKVDSIGNINLISITPGVSKNIQNEVNNIINSINGISLVHYSEIDFSYKILCTDALNNEK